MDKSFVPKEVLFLRSVTNLTYLCHIRLRHADTELICKIYNQELVFGLPKASSSFDLCEACVKGKQVHTSFSLKLTISTSHPLKLFHMDLCGPVCCKS